MLKIPFPSIARPSFIPLVSVFSIVPPNRVITPPPLYIVRPVDLVIFPVVPVIVNEPVEDIFVFTVLVIVYVCKFNVIFLDIFKAEASSTFLSTFIV